MHSKSHSLLCPHSKHDHRNVAPSRAVRSDLDYDQKTSVHATRTKVGSHPMVVLSDASLIKKAFQHPDIQGRPNFLSLKLFCHRENLGVITNEGETWAENRRFLLRQLRDLGMGKTSLEASMLEEASLLVDYLEKTCTDRPAVMDNAINCAVINVLWQMLASKRYNIDDPNIQQYNMLSQELITIIQSKIYILDIFPILHKILPNFVQNKLTNVDTAIKNIDMLHDMSKDLVLEHLESFDPENPRDVIDQFIQQRAERRPDGSLTERDMRSLTGIMFDMFNAGSETTSTTLRWMIVYMAIYPEIQTKVQEALDAVVPRSRLPSLTDRSQLPYVDAVLLEVLRLSSIVPTGVPHRATADVAFEGYTIPKDTIVVGCSKHCHRNSSHWELSDKFHPEHFLNEDGNLAGKNDNFLPFSVGRRQCLGESLARMQLYFFGTAILQNFRIEPPKGVTLSLEVDPSQIFVNQPLPFEVVLRRRN
ncbi:Cytochrome P450 [Trinorchestia longiramus]|nr:Cytochrome P450 [Trinorchestia longiramus]